MPARACLLHVHLGSVHSCVMRASRQVAATGLVSLTRTDSPKRWHDAQLLQEAQVVRILELLDDFALLQVHHGASY